MVGVAIEAENHELIKGAAAAAAAVVKTTSDQRNDYVINRTVADLLAGSVRLEIPLSFFLIFCFLIV